MVFNKKPNTLLVSETINKMSTMENYIHIIIIICEIVSNLHIL